MAPAAKTVRSPRSVPDRAGDPLRSFSTMSFFDVPAPPPEPLPPERPRPPWLSSRRGVLPGYSPQRATVFTTDRAVLFVDRFRLYPTGIMFSLNLLLRERTEDPSGWPWQFHSGRRPDPLPDDFLRFGVLFGDGSKWTNLDVGRPDPGKKPDGPFVMEQGGGGGGDWWDQDYWMWPLPSEGPLTFVASWPAYGVGESSAEVDGTELRRCAEAAETIWPS